MSCENKEMLLSYLRTALSASIAVYMTGNHDYKALGVAGLSAILGPILRWINPSDPSFGRFKSNSES